MIHLLQPNGEEHLKLLKLPIAEFSVRLEAILQHNGGDKVMLRSAGFPLVAFDSIIVSI